MNQKINALAKQVRFYRKVHKYIAVPMMVAVLILGITGLLLTWKSELNLTPSSKAITIQTTQLLEISSIENIAKSYIDSLGFDTTINRIDYRPSKGIAKIRFSNHFTELQINCFTGEIISSKQRTADIIEMIHDGSIIDFLFKSKSENAKLFYSTLSSIGLILLAISGVFYVDSPQTNQKK